MSDRGKTLIESVRITNSPPGLPDLIASLRRLDALLDQLVGAAHAKGGVGAAALRGMYVGPEEAAQLLVRTPCAPPFNLAPSEAGAPLVGPVAPLSGPSLLQNWFGLSPFDLDVVVIALAPELDLRYERLYGYLQDDVTRRRATVDLALSLRTSSADEKMARLAHFAPDAPLIRHAVLHLLPDPNQAHPPLLAHYLRLDPQIIGALLGHGGLDARLASFCRFVNPGPNLAGPSLTSSSLAGPSPAGPSLGQGQVNPELRQGLRALVEHARQSHRSLTLHFHGPAGAGKFEAARALAAELGLGLLHADLGRAGEATSELDASMKVLRREAWLKNAILYLDGIDPLRGEERAASFRSLLGALSPLGASGQHDGITVLSGRHPWIPARDDPSDLISIAFGRLDFAARRKCWRASLTEFGKDLTDQEFDGLAGRFRLTAEQIAQAVATARNQALWRAAATPTGEAGLTAPNLAALNLAAAKPALSDLFAAARAQSGHELARLVRRIKPKQTWRDIVVPQDQTAQLREICDQARLRQLVYEDWGFDRKLSIGKGLGTLFVGPPGTGKTMAAEIIAGELELDLYKIDLSQVVSKYIGETSKNLDRIFTAAERTNAILFFDEADALFGKRSEVKDSHDRYANIEIGYLLQKMEEYEGIAILATNLRQNLDDAFLRRLQSIVEFPFPDEEYRRCIWEVTFPPEAPLAEDVNFAILAQEVKLAGGNIKNIALTAAFYAAAQGGKIRMEDLIRAARREHQKLGRIWDSKPRGPSQE
ncbi:AAA+-type ATPase, SpoVK/Ycf46/Vps4 family [Rhizobiales bacterium GAS113]|nr:AAA+-type ATPase, SpoVK/Ycf46/Vps4 family [Rhizobiales bacterium GAS113]